MGKGGRSDVLKSKVQKSSGVEGVWVRVRYRYLASDLDNLVIFDNIFIFPLPSQRLASQIVSFMETNQ